MIEIFLYSIATLFILFFLGYGLSALLTPKQFIRYKLWLSPWFSVVFLIVILILTNLFGVPINRSSTIVIILLAILSIFSLIKNGFLAHLNIENIVILVFITGNLVLNLRPLAKHVGYLSAISLGNNDIVNYAYSADYLKNGFIAARQQQADDGTLDMFHNIYRWGPPVITAFFLNLFDMRGYQFVYVLECILFSLTIPLAYVLFHIIHKPSVPGKLLVLILASLNVNLIYILYHNFFGQILFCGLQLFFLIFIYHAWLNVEKGYSAPTLNEVVVLGITLGAIYYSYHEGSIFITAPLYFYFGIHFIRRQKFKTLWLSFTQILAVTLLISSFSFIVGNYKDTFRFLNQVKDEALGWDPFRSINPFPNPPEILGIYNLHISTPLPDGISWVASIVLMTILIYGINKAKGKLWTICLMSVYLTFYLWSYAYKHDYFSYYKSITYTLYLPLILFAGGISYIFKRRKIVGYLMVLILFCLELYSAVSLNRKMNRERLSVDRSFITLQQMPSDIPMCPKIYLESVYLANYSFWRRLWIDYFLFPRRVTSFIAESQDPKKQILDIESGKSCVLVSKPYLWAQPPDITHGPTVWENQYFALYMACDNVDCLENYPENLAAVKFQKGDFEDSLLLNGWDIKEENGRWVRQKTATLRLITKGKQTENLVLEASALSDPQSVTVFIDSEPVGTQAITKDKTKLRFDLKESLPSGVHYISLEHAYGYQPSAIFANNADHRTLMAKYYYIGLE